VPSLVTQKAAALLIFWVNPIQQKIP